jgi:hypothetical protein
MILQSAYYSAKRCTGGETVGAQALMKWHLDTNGHQGATNLGIYNCRNVSGSTTLSVHAEGRACDLGTPVQNDWSPRVAEFLRVNSLKLQIQAVIHRRKVWSAKQPYAGWRDYDDDDPHTNHIHAELTPLGASSLSVPLINRLWKGRLPMWFAQVKDHAEIYFTSGFQTKSMPSGSWETTCQPLIAQGVPHLLYPDLPTLLRDCGPLAAQDSPPLTITDAVFTMSGKVSGKIDPV